MCIDVCLAIYSVEIKSTVFFSLSKVEICEKTTFADLQYIVSLVGNQSSFPHRFANTSNFTVAKRHIYLHSCFFENEFEVPEAKELLFELKKRGIVAQESVTSKEEKVAHLDINNAGNLIKTELSIDRLLMFSETNEKNGFDEEFRWKLIINSEGTRLFCYEKELDAAWVDEESVADEIAKAILLLNGRERRRK